MPDQAILKLAPDFTIHREDVTATDTLTALRESQAINSREYQSVHANVIVEGAGGSAKFEALFWSPKAGKFISEDTPIEVTVAAGSAKAITVNAEGRKVFFACTAFGAPATKAHVEVAAFWIDPRYD